MNNDKLKYSVIGLLIGVLTTWFLISSEFSKSNSDTSESNVSSQAYNSVDAHFIEQMIPHHEDAITMAILAQTKAKRPEVKQLAMNIIDDQNHEIEEMKLRYKEWFGRELPTGNEVMSRHGMMGNDSDMHMGIRGDASDMAKLEQAADFDVAFVEHMIPHHQMAVMMASMLKNGTTRPEMKDLADRIITTQTKEIDQMREWLKSW